MKKLVNIVSPYILLLIPIFIALIILLLNPNSESLEHSVELHSSLFKIPQVNLFDVIVSALKTPFK